MENKQQQVIKVQENQPNHIVTSKLEAGEREQEQRQNQEALKRNILEATISGHERAVSTQEELTRQGEKIKKSLGDAESIAKRTVIVENTTSNLVNEAKASKTRKIINCCLEVCFYCCCYWYPTGTSSSSSSTDGVIKLDANNREMSTKNQQILLSKGGQNSSIKIEDNDDNDEQSVNNIDLNKLLDVNLNNDKQGKNPEWKRTLEPLAGIQHSGTDIWYRQVDVSLNQLHQLAEEMGQSIEEQIRLAQMLNVYLNFGIDRIINVNENIHEAQVEKKLF